MESFDDTEYLVSTVCHLQTMLLAFSNVGECVIFNHIDSKVHNYQLATIMASDICKRKSSRIGLPQEALKSGMLDDVATACHFAAESHLRAVPGAIRKVGLETR